MSPEEREAAARFRHNPTPPFMRRAPPGPRENKPIRMNAAAILREVQLYKRREAELVKQYGHYMDVIL